MLISLHPRWRALAPVADVPPGRVLVRRLRGQLIGATRISGSVHVFEGRCPHAGQSLHNLTVSGCGTVECPRHGLKLALAESLCPADSRPVTPLPFRIRGGVIEVSVAPLRKRRLVALR